MLAIRAERLAGQSEDVIVFADDLEGEELRILMNLVWIMANGSVQYLAEMRSMVSVM